VPSNKIIIMGMPAQPPIGGPPHDFGPPVGSGPISAAEVRILYLLVQIQHGLGRMEEAIGSLKAVTNSHREEIQKLAERTIKTESVLPALQTAVDRHYADLDGLGARHNKDLNELKNDVNEVGRRIERDLNEMGRRLDREISDLRNIAHTAVSFGKFGLALLAGGVLAELIRHFYSK
jgi:hypothetical protein